MLTKLKFAKVKVKLKLMLNLEQIAK